MILSHLRMKCINYFDVCLSVCLFRSFFLSFVIFHVWYVLLFHDLYVYQKVLKMLPTYSIWLIIVLGTTDATLLSKVVKLNDGENFALASRDELGPERRLASADILFKLGQLEEKIDRLIKRKGSTGCSINCARVS